MVQDGARPHEVATAVVRELRSGAPTILVLEDVHWADEATLDVLRILVRKVETAPGVVLVTYRDDELDPVHPLRLVLGQLAAAPAVARLKLQPLSRAGVAALAESSDFDPDELYRKTAGNP